MNNPKLRDEEGRLAALNRYGILDSGPEDAFDQITSLVRMALGVPMAAITLVDRDRLTFKSASGMSRSDLPRSQSFCTYTIQDRLPLLISDTVKDSRFSGSPLVVDTPHVRSYLGIPLETSDGFNIGSLAAFDVEPRRFTDAQLSLMQSLAKVVVEQMELRLIGKTDELTGALSRRGFMSEVTRDFVRATRYDRPSALIFLDIDRFKAINDQYGRNAGDEVLRACAEACLKTLRRSDVLGRLGGEEFGMLLPETNSQDAMVCAERIRSLIEGLDIPVGGATVRVTVSCGVAPLTSNLETEAMWSAAADVALYQAKRAGRNRCVSADPGVLATSRRTGFTERQDTGKVVKLR